MNIFTAYNKTAGSQHEQAGYTKTRTKSDVYGYVDVCSFHGCLGTLCLNLLDSVTFWYRDTSFAGWLCYAGCKDKWRFKSSHFHFDEFSGMYITFYKALRKVMPDFFETSKFVNKILGMKKGVTIFHIARLKCNCRRKPQIDTRN